MWSGKMEHIEIKALHNRCECLVNRDTIQIFFALLRSAICGTKLTAEERSNYSSKMLQNLLSLSSKHDLSHVLVHGLQQNNLISKENADLNELVFEALYRCEQIKYEYENLCSALEKAKIPFLPLKGSLLREYYPEEWMRTSCDIDVLVHREDLDRAVAYLTDHYEYDEIERDTHDVSLYSPTDIHVELHFDLVEEYIAQNANEVLNRVWDNVNLCENSEYRYEMSDPYFYFYHIAHMAKHIEIGGCGIRTFLDLWILDHMENIDQAARDRLLEQGGLLQFAESSRKLSRVWFGGEDMDDLLSRMQDFILCGGMYGTSENRVVLHQSKMGGRFGYILSRVFIPFAKLKRYYPILEKHPWLMPLMQIRRWFMLLKPEIAQMAKREIIANRKLEKEKADKMHAFLNEIGL